MFVPFSQANRAWHGAMASMLGLKAMPPVAVSGIKGMVRDAVATDEDTTLPGTFAVAVRNALGTDPRHGYLGTRLGLHSHLDSIWWHWWN